MAQEVECLNVIHQRNLPTTSRHTDYVKLGSIGKGSRRKYFPPGAGGNWVRCLPNQIDLNLVRPREHLSRSGQVKLCDRWKEQQPDSDWIRHSRNPLTFNLDRQYKGLSEDRKTLCRFPDTLQTAYLRRQEAAHSRVRRLLARRRSTVSSQLPNHDRPVVG